MLEIALIKKVMLLIFFAAFVAIVIRLIFASADRYRDAAQIPLRDDVPDRDTKDGEPHHV